MNSNGLLVVGAGGHGRSVAEAAMLEKKWHSIHFVDDRAHEIDNVNGLSVVAPLRDLTSIGRKYQGIIVAIGHNETRGQLIQQILDASLPLATVTHPSAFISQFSEIGPGSAVMAGAVVGANAQLGVGCIVNCNATVDHDCVLQNFCHLGVGVNLPGGVEVGKGVLLQAGVSVEAQLRIPSWAFWSTGKTVTQHEVDKLCTARK